MGYHRPQHKGLHKEIKEQLRAKERFGAFKYADRKAGIAKDGIYSYGTVKTYNKDCQWFAQYVGEHSPQGRNTSLADEKQYATEYIQSLNANKSISAYTVKFLLFIISFICFNYSVNCSYGNRELFCYSPNRISPCS